MLIFCYKKLKHGEKNFNLFNEGEEEAPVQLFNTSVDAIETMNQGGGEKFKPINGLIAKKNNSSQGKVADNFEGLSVLCHFMKSDYCLPSFRVRSRR
ncbi:hypothetical protein MKW98_014509 [Papaver atlanticum]|uniref:Uncharacterized protein n=1 Tax=Papaver atlanticum TaxID=357466 RepID=A0AAD4XGG2_9MAGN|nr:hypothetical protein MKW98_014509 [Papaver atlanticum]